MEKTIKTATEGIAEELRNMAVGDTVHFPIPKYNYNSVRTAPGTTLIKEKLDGWRWKVRVDVENRCVVVKRTA